MLSDDSGCASDMSEYEIDRVEKFVQPSEICTLNARTKHCVIYNYTTGGALTVCMIRIGDINDVGMYHVREHEIGSFGRLDGKSCTNCTFVQYILVQHVHSAHIEIKKTIVNSTGKYVGRL